MVINFFLMTSVLYYIVNFVYSSTPSEYLDKKMKQAYVVPNLIMETPKEVLNVTYEYENPTVVDAGNILLLEEFRNKPVIKWKADQLSHYTLCTIDPYFQLSKDTHTPFLYWLIMNIPGNEISKGDVLAEYKVLGSKDVLSDKDIERMHYRLFLIYKQATGKIQLSNQDKNSVSRLGFNITYFAEMYNLGDPVAANFFLDDLSRYFQKEIIMRNTLKINSTAVNDTGKSQFKLGNYYL